MWQYAYSTDTTVVTDTGLFIMTETDYGFSAMHERFIEEKQFRKIRKNKKRSFYPKSKDEEIMQLYKLGLYEDPLMSL